MYFENFYISSLMSCILQIFENVSRSTIWATELGLSLQCATNCRGKKTNVDAPK